jgi:3-methylcrotonyl-CoA carboxylase alpha subunit
VRVDGEPLDVEAGELSLVSAQGHALTMAVGGAVTTYSVARSPDSTQVLVAHQGQVNILEKPRPPDVDTAVHGADAAVGHQRVVAPMAGTIIKVQVAEGDQVAAQQTLLVLGAMKMEHSVTAPHAGLVRRILHAAGDVVPGGAVLLELDAAAQAPALERHAVHVQEVR